MKEAFIHSRIEKNVKKGAERILNKLGLSISEAIALFYKQVILQNGLPFQVKIPNKKTLETFRKTDAGKDLIEAKDIDDLFRKLKI